jgi:hypothetical protein
MKRIRIVFLAVSVLAFTLASIMPAEAVETSKCGYGGYSYGIYKYITCLTITANHRVVSEFDLSFTNNSAYKVIGHHQIWWCYSTGSPCTTIFNTSQRTFVPYNGITSNCPWPSTGQYCELYPGWHYTFPEGAKLYDTFWEYLANGTYRKDAQTPAIIIKY